MPSICGGASSCGFGFVPPHIIVQPVQHASHFHNTGFVPSPDVLRVTMFAGVHNGKDGFREYALILRPNVP
jgi:hypothetical protein